MAKVKHSYRWITNVQEEREKVRKISGRECPGECCFFSKLLGA